MNKSKSRDYLLRRLGWKTPNQDNIDNLLDVLAEEYRQNGTISRSVEEYSLHGVYALTTESGHLSVRAICKISQKGKSGKVMQEFENLTALRLALERDSHTEVTIPYALQAKDYGDFAILLERVISPGLPVSVILRNRPEGVIHLDTLEHLIEITIGIQKLGDDVFDPEDLDSTEYLTSVLHRVKGLADRPEDVAKFRRAYPPIAHRLASLPASFYSNASLDNFLSRGKHRPREYARVDFEANHSSAALLELVNIIDNPIVCLDHEQKRYLYALSTYLMNKDAVEPETKEQAEGHIQTKKDYEDPEGDRDFTRLVSRSLPRPWTQTVMALPYCIFHQDLVTVCDKILRNQRIRDSIETEENPTNQTIYRRRRDENSDEILSRWNRLLELKASDLTRVQKVLEEMLNKKVMQSL